MSSQKENMFGKRLYIIAAAVIVLIASVYLFVKLDPFNASADDNNQKQVKIWSEKAAKPPQDKQFKILHVMSYHSPWEWTDSQLSGFQAAMKGVNVQYKVMQMDTKRKSDKAWIQQISGEIRQTIDTWKPDLIFGSDDNAQEYVAKYYVNSDIPIVFSAVNAEPAAYGFAGSKNVTGVLERIHYIATLRLLKKLVPQAKKVAIISDTGQMWPSIIESMKQQQPGIEVVSFDVIPTFAEFKQKMLDYQDKVDAVGFLGVFEFKDENGKNVLLEDVLRWLQANSTLPDFSFWEDRVAKGTLCAVTVSGYAQGYQTGLLARSILLDGKSPSSLPATPTAEGIPVINLPAARRLNIKPSADVLLTAKVVQTIALE